MASVSHVHACMAAGTFSKLRHVASPSLATAGGAPATGAVAHESLLSLKRLQPAPQRSPVLGAVLGAGLQAVLYGLHSKSWGVHVPTLQR